MFKPTIFLLGFLAGTVISLAVIFGLFIHQDTSDTLKWVIIGSGFLIGLIIGYIFVKLQNLAFFISGAIGGGFLGLFLYELFLTKLNSDYTTVIMWGTIIIVALICGVIAHKLRDTVLIVVTAFVGSYLAVRAVSLIVGGFPPESAIAEYIKYGAWDDLD